LRKKINKTYDVLLDGRYFCDLVFTGLPELPRLGHEVYSREFHLVPGGAFNSALALTRLGIKTAWPCNFGNDPFSQHIRAIAMQEGLDTTFFFKEKQPRLNLTVAFSFANERAFLSYSDPNPDLPLVRILKETRPAWLLVTRLACDKRFEHLLQTAKTLGTKILMDCQAHHQTIDQPAIRRILGMLDVFAPNAEEACRLTQKENVSAALSLLAEFIPTVIIKRGSQGCICQQNGQVFQSEGIPVKVVDTTGAGDNFNAGFLFGQVRGLSMQESLRMGNICGGLSTQGYGGSTTSPTFAQVERYLKKSQN